VVRRRRSQPHAIGKGPKGALPLPARRHSSRTARALARRATAQQSSASTTSVRVLRIVTFGGRVRSRPVASAKDFAFITPEAATSAFERWESQERPAKFIAKRCAYEFWASIGECRLRMRGHRLLAAHAARLPGRASARETAGASRGIVWESWEARFAPTPTEVRSVPCAACAATRPEASTSVTRWAGYGIIDLTRSGDSTGLLEQPPK
jgi:hypothetical protein